MKTAVITGASSEIGAAVCRALLLSGYRVIGQYAFHPCGFSSERESGAFVPVQSNFVDKASLESFVDFVCDYSDTVDVIVHCAAKHEKEIPGKSEEEVFDMVFRVNVFSPTIITRKLLEKMRTSDNPVVIFISSTYVRHLGSLKNIYYAASKTALHTISRIIARESVPIRSNVIVPGYVLTPTYQQGRSESDIDQDKKAALNGSLVTSSDIAETVLFIIKNKSINGASISVDGGLRV